MLRSLAHASGWYNPEHIGMIPVTQPVTAPKEWTVGGLLHWTERFLAERGAEFPRLDAQVLLAHVLGCQRADLYGTHFAEPAGEGVRQRYRDLVRKRVEGCPVAYLVGRKEFFLLELEVSPAVLIPRPDSETVVTGGLDLAKKLDAPRVLDIGTGSGNLAIAIARQHKGATVTAIDVSPDALAVAARNAARHGVADRVRFLQGDLFAPLGEGEQFDFIVSNPPYIPRGDIPSLPVGVRQYEPHVALDGGPDGFAVFDRLADQARHYLAPGSWLLVEIGAPQEKPARSRVEALPGYRLDATLFDMSGHPRVLRARRVDDR
jgi:release factor glutamine methyltransferase